VRQVLHNLIGNAIKFTDTGEVRVHVSREADKVTFRIEDTGVGIPSQHLPLIFEAFHQVDGTFGRKHKGTGLGLTISREIARAMGGDISCESVMNKGSAFTLTVPMPATPVENVDLDLGDEGTPSAAAPLATSTKARHAGHILLAEDNPVNALVAEATLTNLGVTFTRVEDGIQALAELQRDDHHYDLVLMDCQMPTLDGIEATRRLRVWERNQGRAPIPVIALTANAMNSDRERCMDAGMNEHLPKPFRQSELKAALKRHLSVSVDEVTDKANA
jgi:CheY-like chemotaxis protein